MTTAFIAVSMVTVTTETAMNGGRRRHAFTSRTVAVMTTRHIMKDSSTFGPNGLERVTGIEPAWPAWKAGALPLSYTRERVEGSSEVAESGRTAGR